MVGKSINKNPFRCIHSMKVMQILRCIRLWKPDYITSLIKSDETILLNIIAISELFLDIDASEMQYFMMISISKT